MLDIEYKGGNTVILNTKKARVVVDPKTSIVGFKDTDTKDSIEVATEERFVVQNKDAKLIIDGPGEYELGDISIVGVAARRHIDTEADGKKSTLYRIVAGDVRIALLGNVAPVLSEDQLEDLGVVDMLILPVGGGGYTLDATSAATIVRQIEPHVVIPVHYADPSAKFEVPQDGLEVFTKELAATSEEVGSKYKIKSPSSIPAALTIIKIDRS